MKPEKLIKGDKVAIISLSSGILRSIPLKQLKLGIKRLNQFGLEPIFMNHSLSGLEFLANNPWARADDLKQAFLDKSIKGIICAIGGDDTYRTLTFLLDDPEFLTAVKDNPKIFIGYSDTTINHLMFSKLGLNTFYGHSFIVDFAELDKKMLPYSQSSFETLFHNDNLTKIESSPIWYEERTDFSENSFNKPRKKHKETRGFEVLECKWSCKGKLFGGCIESFYEIYTGSRYKEQKTICKKYGITPSVKDWKNKLVFLETSENKPNPNLYQKMIDELEKKKVFSVTKALIIGKPQDEVFYEEYKLILLKIAEKYDLPILYNVNFGHSHPKTIIPYNCKAKIDFDDKKFEIIERIVI